MDKTKFPLGKFLFPVFFLHQLYIKREFEIRHNLKTQDLQEVNKPKMWLNILNS
jgi:hypothetical protein